MNLSGYLRAIRRQGWLIILAALITGGSALGFSTRQLPFYRSSLHIQILPSRTELSMAQSIQVLLRSYISVMHTTENARKVIDALSLMRTPEDVKSDLTIEPDSAQLVLVFNVEDYDGEQANRIAKAWGELFLQWLTRENQRHRQENRVYAEILEEPRYQKLRPKPLLNTVAGLGFGLVSGTTVVLIIAWLEQGIIHTPRELETRASSASDTALIVVGVIPPLGHPKREKPGWPG